MLPLRTGPFVLFHPLQYWCWLLNTLKPSICIKPLIISEVNWLCLPFDQLDPSSFVFSRAMFTLYRIGFCSVSKVAPVQCEQELMFCCGAEIVPKRSQCEHKLYPLCNLQRSLLIWKDNLPKRGSVAISAPIKVFRLNSDRFKNLSDTERSTFNSGAKQYCSGAETALKPAFLVWTEALSGTLSATLRFTIRYSVNIA